MAETIESLAAEVERQQAKIDALADALSEFVKARRDFAKLDRAADAARAALLSVGRKVNP